MSYTSRMTGLVVSVCLLPGLCHAMPGENVEQLAKRFGKNYTIIDRGKLVPPGMAMFRIRSEILNFDALLVAGKSQHEIYSSRRALDAQGLPPRDALCTILKRYAPGRWIEVDVPQSSPSNIDCLLRSERGDYTASLYYKMQNVEGFKWIVLIEKLQGNRNYKAKPKIYGC